MNINPSNIHYQKNKIISDAIRILDGSPLKLEEAEIFFEFPLYKGDDDNLVVSQLLMISPIYGVVIFYISEATSYNIKTLKDDNKSLDRVASYIVSRLIKNDKLRNGYMGFNIPIKTVLYAPLLSDADIYDFESSNEVVCTEASFIETINSSYKKFNRQLFLESISTIQGAKGLLRPEDRNLENLSDDSKAVKISKVESKILLFDRDQQDGYIPALNGPQRIRGLAGSGKTVILAMKVAQTLLRDDKATILYTFSTKSLYQHVQRLIQRFYREFHDDSTHLDRVTVMHSWGGRSNAGVYYEACQAFNHPFLTFPAAQSMRPLGMDAFEYACKDLLDKVNIEPLYDYVFVDEAQDYNIYFLRLCTKLAKNKQVIFGADVFQNIFQKRIPTAADIFDDGTQFINDKFLEVCYRTPLSILVCAHAIGLGVYGKQAQKIETVRYWKDLGYNVLSRSEGEFEELEDVDVVRTVQKSPTLSDEEAREILTYNFNSKDLTAEVNTICASIVNDIKSEGLLPEDILVICADDYNCNSYFNNLSSLLNAHSIPTNNVHADKISIRDFRVKGRVTLSTIHKAKGNEAYSVYVVGADFLSHNLNIRNRNLLFTAMTRTKGWLYISGIGEGTKGLELELNKALDNVPNIRFKYPSKEEAMQIEHDIKHAENINSKDLTELENIIERFGSFDNMKAFFEEQNARKGKKK